MKIRGIELDPMVDSHEIIALSGGGMSAKQKKDMDEIHKEWERQQVALPQFYTLIKDYPNCKYKVGEIVSRRDINQSSTQFFGQEDYPEFWEARKTGKAKK